MSILYSVKAKLNNLITKSGHSLVKKLKQNFKKVY